VAESRQYAHLAERMGVVAAENATGRELRDDRSVVPMGVYAHPEVAWVGLTEQQARQRSGRVRVLRRAYRNSTAALACGRTEGQLKILADSRTAEVRGALWIGPHATDMIHELALAMRQGISLERICDVIHAHPTFQEAVHEALEPWITRGARRRPEP
jgi:dihydrolipoamide dehydrogenase